jgi:quercetin dioxygenase-like cupin family protein
MIVQEVRSAIATAEKPVTKLLQKSEHGRVIVLGLKKGVNLKEHQTNITTKLVVIEGRITYRQGGTSVVIDRYEDIDIPINTQHAVEALEDSICFLIQG